MSCKWTNKKCHATEAAKDVSLFNFQKMSRYSSIKRRLATQLSEDVWLLNYPKMSRYSTIQRCLATRLSKDVALLNYQEMSRYSTNQKMSRYSSSTRYLATGLAKDIWPRTFACTQTIGTRLLCVATVLSMVAVYRSAEGTIFTMGRSLVATCVCL